MMLAHIHRLSALFFYLLGSSFFVAYVLLRNDVQPDGTAWWMQTADLPLAASTILYGGISMYMSLRNPVQPSKILPWLIAVPLTLLFILILLMNFWRA